VGSFLGVPCSKTTIEAVAGVPWGWRRHSTRLRLGGVGSPSAACSFGQRLLVFGGVGRPLRAQRGQGLGGIRGRHGHQIMLGAPAAAR